MIWLTDGMPSPKHHVKALEYLQSSDPKLNACIKFIQQHEMISKFQIAEKNNRRRYESSWWYHCHMLIETDINLILNATFVKINIHHIIVVHLVKVILSMEKRNHFRALCKLTKIGWREWGKKMKIQQVLMKLELRINNDECENK